MCILLCLWGRLASGQMAASGTVLCGAQVLCMPHIASKLYAAAHRIQTLCCRNLQQGSALTGAKRASHVCVWAAELSPHTECRAISHLWFWILERFKRASAEHQEAQGGSAGAAGLLLMGTCCVFKLNHDQKSVVPCVLGSCKGV